MNKEKRIGVYICHCGSNIAKTVKVKEVTEFASKLPNVTVARNYMFTCSDPGQEMIRKDIKELGLNRVIVAACSPHMHEKTFRRVVKEAGLNSYLYQNANIREHCSWVHEEGATEKAKEIVAAAVSRVSYHVPLFPNEVEINKNTLVVGGGIAGMQASLDIAAGGYQVFLVEKTPSVGGHVIQLDKTFPSLDCSACMNTPKMSDTGSSPNIKLLNYSTVEELSGYTGNFKAKIKKMSKFIDQSKCTGCRICFATCPVVMENEFDLGMVERKAVYIPFPQAVPNKAVIDKREDRPCKASCMQTCPINMNVPGYLKLIATGRFKDAYNLIRATNPLPSTCGRVCFAPCEDACDRGKVDNPLAIRDLKRFADDQFNLSDFIIPEIEKTGKKVGIIGSGPAGLAAAHDLAMLGHSVTIFEALPMAGGMLAVGIPEYRLPKNILGRDIEIIKKLGVEIRTGVTFGKDVTLKGLQDEGYNAFFIATGLHKSRSLNVEGEDIEGVLKGVDFLRDAALGNPVSLGKKVIVVGGGNVAIDVVLTALRLGAQDLSLACLEKREEMPASRDEVHQALEEGVKINNSLGPNRFIAKGKKLSGIEFKKCTSVFNDKGQFAPEYDDKDLTTLEADTVIVAIGQAADTGFAGEMGLTVARNGGIPVSSVSGVTNLEGVFAGGDVVTGPGKAIDAIAMGKNAAVYINRYLKGESLDWAPEVKAKEELTEQEIVELKNKYPQTERAKMPELPVEERVKGFKEVARGFSVPAAQAEAGRCLAGQIEGCIECGECARRCGVDAVDYRMQDDVIEVDVGNVIVATGYDPFDPSPMKQYGYKKYDNVLTALEFERLNNATGPTGGQILMKNGKLPESVAIIHCVGSRDKNYHEYCSKVCCMFGLKFAHLIKDKTGADVYQMYIDMRCAGEGYEEFYERVGTEDGVKFIRGKATRVTDKAVSDEEQGKLTVVVEDTLISKMLRVPVDMIVLLTALEARADAEDVARMFSLSRRADGFFMERHIKLDPIATMTDGVFLAGCCSGPRDIPDTVAQAKAAAAEVLSRLALGKAEIEPTIAIVDEDVCSGCGLCVKVCAYSAPSVIEPQHRSHINEALCKGCGACAATCPSGAVSHKHFNFKEFLSEIEELAA
jgi:heterodisulfide reductase subunit A2